ncbi:MAG: replication-relaxation family protein [Pseudobdellovibrionaceae bacterium]|nr:MAG: replication-relaxation family protein [Pseudobdellovibrionaceae bacterium]
MQTKIINSSKKVSKVILGDRDFRILCFLFENKVATRNQINRYFFGGISKDTVNRRLRKILSLGLICRMSLNAGREVTYCYSLTQRGLTKIRPLLPYSVKGKATLSECLIHDTALVDIRKVFEKQISVQHYFTENVLQSCVDYQDNEELHPFVELNSDAVAFVDSKVGVLKLAIEFDTTHKSKVRYGKKVDEYYCRNGVDGVLYICMEKYNLRGLQKVDQQVATRHGSKPKMYFSLFSNVINAENELIFKNANGSVFRVK